MDEVTITNGFRWSVIAQFRVESLINPAQQDKISILKAGVDRANPNFVEGTLITIFPWEDILDKEVKLVAKQNSQLAVGHSLFKEISEGLVPVLSRDFRSLIPFNFSRTLPLT